MRLLNSIHSWKNDNKIQIRNTIDIKANATVRHQGISRKMPSLQTLVH